MTDKVQQLMALLTERWLIAAGEKKRERAGRSSKVDEVAYIGALTGGMC